MSAPVPGPPLLRIVEAPTRETVRPREPAGARPLEPHRVLFPLGALFAVLGVLPWPAALAGAGGWPGPLHASFMVEGFELCFIAGFLLTAMPAFTHGPLCRPWELAIVTTGVTLFAILRFAGLEVAAPAAFALTVAFLVATLARRVRGGAAAPPEEFALVGAGLLLGVVSGAWQALVAAGGAGEPEPWFALRLVPRGMLLALVLGLGSLLVPTFAMMRDPLAIAGIARAGQRAPRRAFALGLAAVLVAALVAEARGHGTAGAWIRFVAAALSTQLAWKLWRLPGKREPLAWCLWLSGWAVLLGLLGAAVLRAHEVAAWHITLIGGYGLLTLAIATRVVVSHGGHDHATERRVLHPGVLAAVAAALILRAAHDGYSQMALRFYAGAAAAWAFGWLLWLTRAWPLVRRVRR